MGDGSPSLGNTMVACDHYKRTPRFEKEQASWRELGRRERGSIPGNVEMGVLANGYIFYVNVRPASHVEQSVLRA